MQKKSAPQQVRIIAGIWKRTPLTVLDAPGLRPTPDRVRETVFNWLNFLFQSNWSAIRCLDLYAGSGALGFEAASRGAAQVTLVEAHTPAVLLLEKSRDKLQAQQIQIIRGDAQIVAQKLAAKGDVFDVIFLDPPFHRDLLVSILPICLTLLHPDGVLYLEAEKALTSEDLPECLSNWQVIRCDRAGKVFFHLLQRSR
ncbi:16S rRNA (guanine(966)-N(2))-methyltransferase RsmD [Solimicrobium silvestre]|uniref:RNA methyltransferase n=1 Tax=Solimicrobium silvestre TaxID=2099400 RepID=A0A2S9H120_9BURK|nr:16S rRNA (guanine(966)-N(2))-methyltransferase RsmD [Solimicrobium silvestre]PRC93684.1 RNA methyltransferase [Solimicrobium silvestre]